MIRKTLFIMIVSCGLINAAVKVRSAEVYSKDQQLYGRYEVRMRTAQGSGILSTFFLYENDSWITGTNNPWREIDIEVLGRYTDEFQTNIITGIAEKRVMSEFFATIDVNPAESYNTYTIEWTPDYISFLFNGKVVRKTDAGDSKKQVEDCRDIPQSYRFNFWANTITGWVGAFNESILPKYQFVNWIKYYKYSKDTKAFTLEWTDNFDTFDAQRWSKATHVIEDFTQFSTQNAIVKDGTLILAMTDLNSTGLTGFTVPGDNATSISQTKTNRRTQVPLSISYQNDQIVCRITDKSFAGATFELINLNGTTLKKINSASNRGMNEIIFNSSDLSNGRYLIKAVSAGSTTTVPLTFVR